jgi:hypothetical protein
MRSFLRQLTSVVWPFVLIMIFAGCMEGQKPTPLKRAERNLAKPAEEKEGQAPPGKTEPVPPEKRN